VTRKRGHLLLGHRSDPYFEVAPQCCSLNVGTRAHPLQSPACGVRSKTCFWWESWCLSKTDLTIYFIRFISPLHRAPLFYLHSVHRTYRNQSVSTEKARLYSRSVIKTGIHTITISLKNFTSKGDRSTSPAVCKATDVV
jgi:hypothetical protein